MGRIAGIPGPISPSWFLVAAVITVAFAPIVRQRLPESGSGAFAIALTFAVLLYASVLFHEISHALTARALGLPVRGITLHFLGGYNEIERNAPTPGRDLVVSAAGPLVSLAAGVPGVQPTVATAPSTHEVAPARAQAPTPQVVVVLT